MFAAAIVGIAAAFAMQSVVLEGSESKKVLGATDVTTDSLKHQVGTMEQKLLARSDELATSVEMLASELQALRMEVKNLKMRAPVVAAPTGEGGEPVAAPTNLSSAINQALDDRDRRREEEREAEREKWAEGMRTRAKEMMTGRTQRIAEENGWDAAKTQTVNQIMSDYYDKMGEMGMSMFGGGRGRRGGFGGRGGGSEESRAQMQQLMEDTKTKLLTVVTEEEANQLLRSRGPGGGSRDRRPGGGGR
jgi:hypothetical protein